MKRNIKTIMVTAAMLLPSILSVAGNKDRAGASGANELLINPWARSSGWMGINVASVTGVEAQYLYVAGTAFTTTTELGCPGLVLERVCETFQNSEEGSIGLQRALPC